MKSAESTPKTPEKRRKVGRPRNVTPSAEYEERRNAIVEAAARVFREKGYERGSLDDVAQALDIRKASLYYYVKSKAELIGLVFETALIAAREDIAQLKKIDDSGERLRMLIKHQIGHVTSDLSHFAVFFDHMGRHNADVAKSEKLRELERAYFQAFSETVEYTIADARMPNVNPRYATHAIMGMTCWTYKWFDPERHDAATLVDTCIQLLLGPGAQSPDG